MISLYTLRVLLKRKVSTREKISSFLRVLRLKLFFFLFPKGKLIIPFYRNAQFILQRGFNNAIGNYYAGLLEPDDMLYITGVLRENDLFFDVGSNIGSYTLLASAVCRANTVAFEPVPSTFGMLKKNVAINGIEDRVKLFNAGVGSESGTLRFTVTQGGKNFVIPPGMAYNGPSAEVPVLTLDSLGAGVPVAMKIDVEGFELEVLHGASGILSDERLKTILIEINGLESRYEVTGQAIHEHLLEYGFRPYRFVAREKRLEEVKGPLRHNTLYIRDIEFVQRRLGIGRTTSAIEQTVDEG